ncbi:MAG: AmmeMemoRadiSam system radical SAM enzyme [Anaerolineae bacterium]|nr:AmmeMemoRadiSam system radical SAM enzyme [Anaerolineae bacterium]
MHKEAYLTKPLSGQTVQCQTCEHFCTIKPGEAGKCRVRQNADGQLNLIVYGEPVAAHVDPIEKKPLFHFMPGSSAFSIGTYGCNFRCPFCQNWQISQKALLKTMPGQPSTTPPEAIVDACIRGQIPVIAYTYNEPTVFFEYTYDTAKLAHEAGIKNVYVSNGFMSRAALDMIEPYLDAINIDLKAFTQEFYETRCEARLEPVKRNIAHIARNTDIWIEVTTLLIPGLNDRDSEIQAMTEWLAGVSIDIPWHISAFHPDYQMHDRPPTSDSMLIRAYEIGKRSGLRHVYVGNIIESERGSTQCPECGHRLVMRDGYVIKQQWNDVGTCPECGCEIAGVWS